MFAGAAARARIRKSWPVPYRRPERMRRSQAVRLPLTQPSGRRGVVTRKPIRMVQASVVAGGSLRLASRVST
jgi:hypothetical protein